MSDDKSDWLDELDRHQQVRGAVVGMSQLLRTHARELIDAAKLLEEMRKHADHEGFINSGLLTGFTEERDSLKTENKRLREALSEALPKT